MLGEEVGGAAAAGQFPQRGLRAVLAEFEGVRVRGLGPGARHAHEAAGLVLPPQRVERARARALRARPSRRSRGPSPSRLRRRRNGRYRLPWPSRASSCRSDTRRARDSCQRKLVVRRFRERAAVSKGCPSKQGDTGMATKSETRAEKPAANASKSSDGKAGGNTSAIVGAAIGGVALGVMAMIGRKVAVQAPTALAGDWDEALAAEHKATLKLFDALEATDEQQYDQALDPARAVEACARQACAGGRECHLPGAARSGRGRGRRRAQRRARLCEAISLSNSTTRPTTAPISSRRCASSAPISRTICARRKTSSSRASRPALDEEKNKHLTLAMNKEGFKLA